MLWTPPLWSQHKSAQDSAMEVEEAHLLNDMTLQYEEREALFAAMRPIDSYPEMCRVFAAVATELNRLRLRVGLSQMEVQRENVQLVDAAVWDARPSPPRDREPDAMCYVPDQQCVLRFDEDRYRKNQLSRIDIFYGIAHEMGHCMAGGLREFSVHLDEGFTDYLARHILERRVYPSLSHEEHERRSGHPAGQVRQLVYANEKDGTLEYAYQEELRIVQYIADVRPALHAVLAESYLKAEATAAETAMRDAFGRKVANMLKQRNPDLEQCLNRMKEAVQSAKNPPPVGCFGPVGLMQIAR